MECFIEKSGLKRRIKTNRKRYWGSLDFKELKVSPAGLLDLALDSLEHPVSEGALTALRKTIPLLKKADRDILSTRPEQLSSDDVRRFYSAIEFVISGCALKNKYSWLTARSYSYNIRTLLSEIEQPLQDGLLIQHVPYKTIIKASSKGRGLISDLYDAGCLDEDMANGDEFSQPISKIPFISESDYTKRAVAHMEYRLKRISDAAWKTIDDYRALKLKIEEVLLLEVPDDVNQLISDMSCSKYAGTTYDKFTHNIQKYSVNIISAGLFQCFENNKMYVSNIDAVQRRLWGANYIYDKWKEYEYFLQGTIRGWLGWLPLSRSFIPLSVMTSARLLFQLHDGWNWSAVTNIKTDDVIKMPNGEFHITGIKLRNDQIEGMVIHPQKDKALHRLCSELLEYQKMLARMCKKNSIPFAAGSENRLFSTLYGQGIYEFVVALLDEKKKRGSVRYFLKCNDIVLGNVDQIRTQIYQLDLLLGGNIEEIRANMNHSDMGTTGVYLTQVVSQRMNTSRLRLFKQQLEAGVIIAWGGEDKLHELDMLPERVRPGLYFPIGNGLSCGNIYKDSKEFELCDAKNCLGCDYGKFVINRKRMEEVVRLQYYYNDNWRRLYAESKLRFEIEIVDKIILNHILYEFIELSEMSHELRNIERTLREKI